MGYNINTIAQVRNYTSLISLILNNNNKISVHRYDVEPSYATSGIIFYQNMEMFEITNTYISKYKLFKIKPTHLYLNNIISITEYDIIIYGNVNDFRIYNTNENIDFIKTQLK